jgi:hypothetical protein
MTSEHVENVTALKVWIDNLPEHYRNKEIVFVGYSKGASISSHLTAKYSDIRDRTRAIISLGGVIQGSNNSEEILANLYKIDPTIDPENFKEKVNTLSLNNSLESFIKQIQRYYFLNSAILKNLMLNLDNLGPRYKRILGIMFKRLTGGEIYDFLKGFYETGQYYMLNWNLEYFNDQSFDRPISFFNLSFISNQKDWLLRGPISEFGKKLPPELVPQLTTGGIAPANFSLDLLIQALTSLNLFERSILGMSDTQMSWNESKAPQLDHLPLIYTLPKESLKRVYENPKFKSFFKNSKISFEDFINLPRKEIFLKRGTKDMHFVDLGEMRGTHWSCVYRQLIRLPGVSKEDSHVHSFPHKAMTKALIETYAIYKTIRDGK